MKVLWLLTLIGALFGGATILFTLAASSSAPQQAAGFAMACALAIVPYVFSKAVQGMVADSTSEEVDRIIAAIKQKKEESAS